MDSRSSREREIPASIADCHALVNRWIYAEEARESDENQSRLDVLSAWRELDCFSFEERTALAWTEALTLIHSSTITEEMYNSVESTFGKEGLIELTSIILQINSWNRISVSLQFQPSI